MTYLSLNSQIGPHRAKRHMPATAQRQQGAVLAVALIMLVVMTFLGLAAIGGVTMQSKMASNQYDRQLAFQAAASSLQVAVNKIANIEPTDPDVARNCKTLGTNGSTADNCGINPFTDTNFNASGIHSVAASSYSPESIEAGTPQFVIENMGIYNNPKYIGGGGRSAASFEYGSEKRGIVMSSKLQYYRVTVRNADPTQVGGRAVVALQAVVSVPAP